MGNPVDTINFTINGISHTVSVAEYSNHSLASYVREVAGLTGTKVSCNEGGCGACIVTVDKGDGQPVRSVNACLAPVPLCSGWKVTTVEGLGAKPNYHPIQVELAANGGTQCGFCSPGMVMQLHSFLQEHPEATMEQIDNILDGNICRCTGYRPILDAFKKFGSDAPGAKERVAALVADIEDLGLGGDSGICKRTGKACPGAGQCSPNGPGCHSKTTDQGVWHKPSTEQELLEILASFTPSTKYRIVGGNTGTGVFKHDEESYDAFVDINHVVELKQQSQEPMVLGANVSITDAIHFFGAAGEAEPVFSEISHHLSLIASVGIKNQGTLAGNLMMKHAHQDFPSDVFLTLTTIGAMLEIVKPDGSKETVSTKDFLALDMSRRYIRTINIPSLRDHKASKPKVDLNVLWKGSMPRTPAKKAGPKWFCRSFKIMPRSSNAHAYVNAGFLALVDVENAFTITQKPTVVFGGIREDFIHANGTEEFLIGRSMSDHDMFEEALVVLATELQPAEDPVLSSSTYRRQLALGLFYKFFLHVLGDSASPAVRSGADDITLQRGLTSGKQNFETDESLWPVSQPIEKVEAKWQTAGEAEYIGDIPERKDELHAAFVLSSLANATVVRVDSTKALAMPGVVTFIDAQNVPGVNNWKFSETAEEIFCTGTSKYAGQSLGLVIAESREIALAAARQVQVEYQSLGPVVVDIEKGMEDPLNIAPMLPAAWEYGDVDAAMASAAKVVQGRFRMGSQYHFHMETQTAIVTPVEDGFDVAVASQDINQIQNIVAMAMAVPSNSVNVTVRRLGGSYGGKISLPNHVAAAAAVAANEVKRPVRLWVPLEDNMRMLGKRNQYLFDYRIGLSAEGKIQALTTEIYADGGWSLNDVDSMFAIIFGQSCYKIPTARMMPYGVRLNTPTPTAMRAPGMCNGHAMIESIMQHCAAEMSMTPSELREANLVEQGDPIMPPGRTLEDPSPIAMMIEKCKTDSDFVARRQTVDDFNSANRWKKRGLSMVPMRYDHWLRGFGLKMNALVSIFGSDGTISVTHNGIEMGQGMNTKVVQCVAQSFGVPMEMIQVKPVTTVTNPNGSTTGGSCGSESNCVATRGACEILKARLAPYKAKLGPKATWLEVIQEANASNVDLCAHYMMDVERDKYYGYQVWGVVVTEVEVDILTGEMRTVRTDLLEDAGLSTSPIVDIGQVEGAFITGLGLWTSEEIKYHPETGQLLTMNTWEYKPPAAKDIPQDFRVTLLPNARNPHGVLSSKATGEPALLMGISVLFSIWDALNSSRKDSGQSGWWQLNGPATVEHTHQNAGTTPDQFVF